MGTFSNCAVEAYKNVIDEERSEGPRLGFDYSDDFPKIHSCIIVRGRR